VAACCSLLLEYAPIGFAPAANVRNPPLVSSDTTGPNRTLAVPYNAAVQLSHCSHSCTAPNFFGSIVGVRDEADFAEFGNLSLVG
jgi:hypothetical protein